MDILTLKTNKEEDFKKDQPQSDDDSDDVRSCSSSVYNSQLKEK